MKEKEGFSQKVGPEVKKAGIGLLVGLGLIAINLPVGAALIGGGATYFLLHRKSEKS